MEGQGSDRYARVAKLMATNLHKTVLRIVHEKADEDLVLGESETIL